MRRKTFTAAVLAMLLFFLAGCASTPGKIDRNPSSYDGKIVRVKGRVEKIYNIPLTDISVFMLRDDETGVPVASFSASVEEGRRVVKGRVWAFPESGMNAGSTEAVEAVKTFLVDNDIVSREKGTEVSALVLTVVRKLAAGLGEVWFIIEGGV